MCLIYKLLKLYQSFVTCQQQLSTTFKSLYTFFPNKSFGQVVDISTKNPTFLKTINSEFSYIEVCFIDKNSTLLETKDKINISYQQKCKM